jgi:hypothetical protein
MSWKSRWHSHTESAIGAIRLVVSAYRARGLKGEDSLREAAIALDATPRRMRCLFYRDGAPIVLSDEWNRLRFRAAAALRREADELRQRADYYDSQADALEGAQASLWGNEWGSSHAGSGSRRRRVA